MPRCPWPLLVALALTACSNGESNGSDGAPVELDLAPAPDLGPVPAPFGLDARPANPSCVAPARPPMAGSIALMNAFPDLPALDRPVFALQAPGDATRWFVGEQTTGVVKTFANNAAVTAATTFVTVPSVKVGGSGEGGLLGMAFSPTWASDRDVFLSATFAGSPGGGSNDMHSEVFRVSSMDAGLTLDLATRTLALQVDQPADNHNGGGIAFGPDGYLYIGFGDGGGGGDTFGSGQNLNTFLAKFLRINVAQLPYTIPPSNPFAAATDATKKETFAYGFRNPWRWSFDRVSGELWAGDVGQNEWEEIDRVSIGGNYGWPIREGKHCYGAATCNTAGLVDPIVDYTHANGDRSTVGGYVYRGSAIPSLVGTYVFADTYSGHIWGIFYDPITGAASAEVLVTAAFGISSFAEGNDGELYVLSLSDGQMQRIVPMGTPPADVFPKKLSQTGCVDASNPKLPAPGLIPYAINSPLWSDGADKERYFAIPDGSKMGVAADGDLDLPIGSVAMKSFSVAGKRVETRLFVRHDDGNWAGYSYEWDDAESDATLLPAGKTKSVGAQTWTYPSRAECLACHTDGAGRTLGLELGQLARSFVYASTNRLAPQLATLEHIGLFSSPLPATVVAYPEPQGTAPLAERAASYLHANCAMCHRPLGNGRGPADFRYGADPTWAKICGVNPTEGDLGQTGAKLLAPGNPASSLISLRMHRLTQGRMPPLGSAVVDTAGLVVVDAWISGLTSCP